MFAGFQNDAELIAKQEANQLQVIKKADIFNEGKYKKLAEEMVIEGEEYYVNLKEDDDPKKAQDQEEDTEPKPLTVYDKVKQLRDKFHREEHSSQYSSSEHEEEL